MVEIEYKYELLCFWLFSRYVIDAFVAYGLSWYDCFCWKLVGMG